jgi:hypothetical protein
MKRRQISKSLVAVIEVACFLRGGHPRRTVSRLLLEVRDNHVVHDELLEIPGREPGWLQNTFKNRAHGRRLRTIKLAVGRFWPTWLIQPAKIFSNKQAVDF